MPTALITGASGGAGRVVTRYFLEQGWHVHANCHSASGAEELRAELTEPLQQRLSITVSDLTTPHGVEQFVREAPNPVHALVHLVGGIRAGTLLEETEPETFEAMVQLNALTTFLLLRAVMPLLKATSGAIVTVAARAVLRPEQRKGAYAAAKAAVVALTQTAAEEGRPYGVRANVVVPSILKTPANLAWAQAGEEATWVPLEDFAAAVFALCSDAGRAVSGALIPMYGGLA